MALRCCQLSLDTASPRHLSLLRLHSLPDLAEYSSMFSLVVSNQVSGVSRQATALAKQHGSYDEHGPKGPLRLKADR